MNYWIFIAFADIKLQISGATRTSLLIQLALNNFNPRKIYNKQD